MERLDLAGRIEPLAKRVRALQGGRTILDTTAARLVWEHGYYPQYLIPLDDVAGTLSPTDAPPSRTPPPNDTLGPPRFHHLVLGDAPTDHARTGDTPDQSATTATAAPTTVDPSDGPATAWTYDHPDAAGFVRLAWDVADTWLEEDEPVIVHPRSPYVHVDSLRSSRAVRVTLDGTVLAESSRAVALFETGLPARWYLPLTDCATETFVASDTTTSCPYKGHATYFSVEVDGTVHDDLVWTYEAPLPEARGVQGLVCFFPDRVELTVT